MSHDMENILEVKIIFIRDSYHVKHDVKQDVKHRCI